MALQTVRVELRLLLPHPRVFAGALGLYHCQRQAVVPPQHIIDVTLSLGVGHALHFELAVTRLVKGPARFGQQQVDERIGKSSI